MSRKLIHEFCKFFKCEIKDLQKYLFCPFNRRKLIEKYRNILVRTTYKNRNGTRHVFRLAGLSLQDAKHCKAYNSFLGVTVLQHFYARHRIFVKNHNLPCVLELTPQQDTKYYPIELLEVYDDEDEYQENISNKNLILEHFIDNINTVALNYTVKVLKK